MPNKFLAVKILMFCTLVLNGQPDSLNKLIESLKHAKPGDTIFIYKGTYQLSKALRTFTSGTSEKRITIKGKTENERPIIISEGRAFHSTNSYITLENIVFNGSFGTDDIIKIDPGSDYFILNNCEIFNGARDGVQVKEADNVLINNCKIHHMLRGSFNQQEDAHGICGVSMNNLTIRDTEIFYVSGDCFQTDPSRNKPYWNNVLIENCKFWTGPLPANAALWKMGESPGENAIDTKTTGELDESAYRATVQINGCEIYGFNANDYIKRRAGLNLKNQVRVEINNLVIHDCQIAFRLRGPHQYGGAHVYISNIIAYNNDMTFRLEDNLQKLVIKNSIFDNQLNQKYFYEAGAGANRSGLEILKCIFVFRVPEIAVGNENIMLLPKDFIDYTNHNYNLKK